MPKPCFAGQNTATQTKKSKTQLLAAISTLEAVRQMSKRWARLWLPLFVLMMFVIVLGCGGRQQLVGMFRLQKANAPGQGYAEKQ